MTEAFSANALRAVFAFPLADRETRSRFLIGALLCLAGWFIPIIPMLAVYGYLAEILRLAAAGEELTLPEWKDFGKLLLDGLRLVVVGLAFLLPGIIILFGGIILYTVTSFFFPIMATTFGKGDDSLVITIMGLSMVISLVIMMFSMVLGTVLLLLAYIPLPAALTHFAVRDRLGAAFAWNEWWPILRVDKLGYFICWVIIFGLLFGLSLALTILYYTICLCLLIPILAAPLIFYILLVAAALFGQAYREGIHLLASQPA